MDLSQFVIAAIKNKIMDLDICFPVTIKAWNKATLTADVETDLATSFYDGTVLDPLIIKSVPICYPMSSESANIFPLKSGDKAICVVAQRNLDNWKNLGSKIPKDATMFQPSDALLIPGVSHKKMLLNYLRLSGEGNHFIGKKVFIGDLSAIPNPVSTMTKRDLLQALDGLITNLLTATYPTSMGPTGPMVGTSRTIIEAIQSEIQELLT